MHKAASATLPWTFLKGHVLISRKTCFWASKDYTENKWTKINKPKASPAKVTGHWGGSLVDFGNSKFIQIRGIRFHNKCLPQLVANLLLGIPSCPSFYLHSTWKENIVRDRWLQFRWHLRPWLSVWATLIPNVCSLPILPPGFIFPSPFQIFVPSKWELTVYSSRDESALI